MGYMLVGGTPRTLELLLVEVLWGLFLSSINTCHTVNHKMPNIKHHMPHINYYMPHTNYHMPHNNHHMPHINYYMPHTNYHILYINHHMSHISYYMLHTNYHMPHPNYHMPYNQPPHATFPILCAASPMPHTDYTFPVACHTFHISMRLNGMLACV